MKTKLFFILAIVLLCSTVKAQNRPSIPARDRTRLAEAFRLDQAIGDRIWAGWSKVPFAVLLVTPDLEFLMRHPQPSADFTLLGYDRELKCNVFFRKRTFPTHLLATAPFIQGSSYSTIVVGQAENTEAQTSTPWVITLFHEHFHQLQNVQPAYFPDVNALNLAGGDKTGMWMLNYAFPYDKADLEGQFSELGRLLAEAINAHTNTDRQARLAAYLTARQQFQDSLSPADLKYLSFQFWQEGIARYTEYLVAKFAAEHYRPRQEFRSLKDYVSFQEHANAVRSRIITQIQTQKLSSSKRVVVYPFGAGEGLLLDAVRPSWHDRYFVDKFDLRKYYPDALPHETGSAHLQL